MSNCMKLRKKITSRLLVQNQYGLRYMKGKYNIFVEDSMNNIRKLLENHSYAELC